MKELEKVKEFKFGELTCEVFQNHVGEFFMTREQIGTALDYPAPMVAIGKIHNRHKERLDQFSFTTLVNGREMYYYTAKGIYEICRWSHQPKADAFYDRVYDLLEALRAGGARIETNGNYPLNPTIAASVADLGRVTERVMKNQGSAPYKIAEVFKAQCEQFGIWMPDDFVVKPAFEKQDLFSLLGAQS